MYRAKQGREEFEGVYSSSEKVTCAKVRMHSFCPSPALWAHSRSHLGKFQLLVEQGCRGTSLNKTRKMRSPVILAWISFVAVPPCAAAAGTWTEVEPLPFGRSDAVSCVTFYISVTLWRWCNVAQRVPLPFRSPPPLSSTSFTLRGAAMGRRTAREATALALPSRSTFPSTTPRQTPGILRCRAFQGRATATMRARGVTPYSSSAGATSPLTLSSRKSTFTTRLPARGRLCRRRIPRTLARTTPASLWAT